MADKPWRPSEQPAGSPCGGWITADEPKHLCHARAGDFPKKRIRVKPGDILEYSTIAELAEILSTREIMPEPVKLSLPGVRENIEAALEQVKLYPDSWASIWTRAYLKRALEWSKGL